MKYGFIEHLKEKFPSQIMVDVTEYCNLKCVHCPHPTFVRSEHFNGSQLKKSIHKKLIDEIKKDGLEFCQYLRYTSNGEPLIHKDFISMVEYAGKTIPSVPINVTTNGVLLNNERALALLNAGVNVFDISIDAFYNETYAKIRVKGNLDNTRNNVLNLIKLIKEKKFRTKVVVSYVEQDGNLEETELFRNFWNDAGADYVVIRPIHSAAGAVDTMKEIMINNQKRNLVKRKPCLYPWERLILSPRGHLGYCPADWKYGSKFVDFSETTIKEAWNGKFMTELRKAHLENNFSCHKFCGQCPDWEKTKWPNEGRSYNTMMNEVLEKKDNNRKQNINVPSDLL